VAQKIGELDADIIGLEEVRDCDVLQQLIALLPNSGTLNILFLLPFLFGT
jgi:hypothetical protein